MKYYLLCKNVNNKACSLENRNSFVFRKQYYDNKLFEEKEPVEISFGNEISNKYLPFKNVTTLYGLNDSFIVDETTMHLLQNNYSDCFSFIEAKLINEKQYENNIFYILYFKHLLYGINEEESAINFNSDDIYVVEKDIVLPSVFKFKQYKMLTFADETFKIFVEENNIEGWIFREAFEK